MKRRDTLGPFELQVLLAAHRLRSNAYGVTIRRDIADRENRNISYGQIYTTLDRLEEKGFVKSWRGEPTKERGGRAKRFIKLRAAGVTALEASVEAANEIRGALATSEV